MARAWRVFIKAAVYHVYNPLARGERVSGEQWEAAEYRQFLAHLDEAIAPAGTGMEPDGSV